MTNEVDESPVISEITAGDSDEIKAELHETAVVTSDERLAYRGVFQRLLVRPEIGALIGAGAIWAFFWAVSKEFGTVGGILPVLSVTAISGIMAVAVALLMIGGEFDLSSGAATGALGIVTILLVKDVGDLGGAGLNLWVALPISFVVALGLGWFNGTMVERTGLPSFIITLATFFILRGFKLGFSKLIIDNITVGTIDEGEGYDFFVKLFGSDWTRNDHVWSARDPLHSILIFAGIVLVGLGIYEINYARKTKMNSVGLAVFVAGAVGAVAGVLMLHGTDGVGANIVASLIITGSTLVGLFGLGMWRYRSQPLGAVSVPSQVVVPLVGGVALIASAVVAAILFDVDSQEPVLDLVGGLKWILVVVAAIAAGAITFRRRGVTTGGSPVETLTSLTPIVTGAFVAGFTLYAFMYMSTEQGLRAMLFALLMLAGVVGLAYAAQVAGRRSPATRSLVLVVLSLCTLAVALFVRGESASAKFRAEVFSVMIGFAVVMLAWALISGFFETRGSADASADRLGAILGGVGVLAVFTGVMIRILFTVQAEIDRNIPPAQFRVDVIWFAAVTVLATVVLGRTKFGSWIFAVGGNKQAARQIGVPAARTKTQLFMIVSVAAWLVGLLLAFRLNTIQSNTGNGLEFDYIIAAVVGGTLLTGGYGSAFGAAIGAFIIAMSKQGIPLARWNSDWNFAFLGVILVVAVIANNFIRSKAESSR